MITRRTLVGGFLSGLAVDAVVLSGPEAAMAADPAAVVPHRLLELLHRPGEAGNIGKAALRQLQGEMSGRGSEDIVRALLGRHPGLAGQASLPERRRLLQEVISEDFARQHTLIVDGWLLSRSETELFILQALNGS